MNKHLENLINILMVEKVNLLNIANKINQTLIILFVT